MTPNVKVIDDISARDKTANRFKKTLHLHLENSNNHKKFSMILSRSFLMLILKGEYTTEKLYSLLSIL